MNKWHLINNRYIFFINKVFHYFIRFYETRRKCANFAQVEYDCFFVVAHVAEFCDFCWYCYQETVSSKHFHCCFHLLFSFFYFGLSEIVLVIQVAWYCDTIVAVKLRSGPVECKTCLRALQSGGCPIQNIVLQPKLEKTSSTHRVSQLRFSVFNWCFVVERYLKLNYRFFFFLYWLSFLSGPFF